MSHQRPKYNTFGTLWAHFYNTIENFFSHPFKKKSLFVNGFGFFLLEYLPECYLFFKTFDDIGFNLIVKNRFL